MNQPAQYSDDTEPDRSFLGIYDYRYAPYSLGDTVTWQMNVLISAIEAGAGAIDHILVVDPNNPACRMQPHINAANYTLALQNIFPAFLCSPLLRGIRLFRTRAAFNLFLLSRVAGGHKTYPSFANHLLRRMRAGGIINSSNGGFPLNHSLINAFNAKHGYLPRLAAPRGYEEAARTFLRRYATGKRIVTVHMRQSRLSASAAALHRDSMLSEWDNFFKATQLRWPEVMFVILGGYQEWERPIMFLDNVIIPRAQGFGLAHDLAFLHQSDLFIGASSGFSAMATFSAVPYVIVDMEHDFSKYNEIPVGESRYPFALENQSIYWQKENAKLLLELFAGAYHRLKTRGTQPHQVTQGR